MNNGGTVEGWRRLDNISPHYYVTKGISVTVDDFAVAAPVIHGSMRCSGDPNKCARTVLEQNGFHDTAGCGNCFSRG